MEDRSMRIKSIFDRLGLKTSNPGGCSCINSWISDPKGKDLVSYDPTSGQPLASTRQVTEETYERILENAQGTFRSWRNVPAPKRGLLVRDLGNALREVQEPLGELVSLEMGKIKAEGVGEVQEMIDICDFAVGLSRQLYGLSMHSERPGHRMYEQWHPLGTIGIITSFNFPAAVWAWNAAIAAVCGNTMLWNPSSSVNLVAIAVQHVANRVMREHDAGGVFNLVSGSGRTIGEKMLNDRRLPLISFTGSVPVGRHVGGTVTGRLGRTILELGGNNAVLVSDKADLDLALRAILFGAVGTAGQRCTSTRRVIAQEKISKELTQRLMNAYKQVRIGDPLDERTLMGPLINRQAVETMTKALRKAEEEGGEILYGGKERPDLGECFVEPAIVKMKEQTPLVLEETFAPILYIIDYKTLEEAVTLHNEVPQGLSSAMFTNDLQEAEQFLSSSGSDCGIANINLGTSGAEIGGAFGGEKDTGGGRESGSDAWKGYMRRQTNTINWSDSLPLAQGINFG